MFCRNYVYHNTLVVHTSGQGPLYYCLKLLVFGNEEPDDLAIIEGGENGTLPSTKLESGSKKDGSAEAATSELSTAQYCAKLIFCIVGLQGAYLTWGVLQVSL